MIFDDFEPRPIRPVQSLRHGTTVAEFLKEHCQNNPAIVIVGLSTGKVFYDGLRDDVAGKVLNMAVRMAHPDQKKYAYCGNYEGEDGDAWVYKIVVNDKEET